MMTDKKRKIKINRRPAGLVITPPRPRPIEDNHPARLLFREAIENEKASLAPPVATSTSEISLLNVESEVEASITDSDAATFQEPTLRIFKDLGVASTLEEIHNEESPRAVEDSAGRITPELSHSSDSVPFPSEPKDFFRIVNDHSVLTESESRSFEPDADRKISFEEFEQSFRKRLSKAQLRICKVLFERTYNLGASNCLIRVTDLMEQAQVKRRNLFLSLNELEKAGFVERGAVYNTPTKKGMEISFYPVPHIRRMPALRTYHYFDAEN